MQQRRLRPGDILDDYCPRERRLTNHAIVAMIDDEIKQTRCTTCDAEHEYRQGKMPALRRKKDAVAAAYQEVLAAVTGDALPVIVAPPPVAAVAPRAEEAAAEVVPVQAPPPVPLAPATGVGRPDAAGDEEASTGGDPGRTGLGGAEDGRVHRRLIRATLPRPENQAVERPIPEFTLRQANDRARFRGGTARGAGGRGGGSSAGHGRGPVFGRPSGPRTGGHGGRPSGRPDAHRPHRSGSGRQGKKRPK